MTNAAATIASPIGEKSGWREISGPLFRKYVALFLAVVCVALLSNGVFEIWFSYQEHKASLVRIQHEQAESAAAKIGQFIKEIESQVGWTTQLPWSAGTIEQRRTDGQRLLRSEEHTSELQSASYIVCRLLLEKKRHRTSAAMVASPEDVLFTHITARMSV